MINSSVLYIYIYIYIYIPFYVYNIYYVYNRTVNHSTATFSKIAISESGCVAAKWIEVAMEKAFCYWGNVGLPSEISKHTHCPMKTLAHNYLFIFL